MAETAVIDRDKELAAIGAFLDGVSQGPAALVLSGEAGIGKTMLLRVGVARARESFACVLTCRGIEGEASLSFAGLSDLLGAARVAGFPDRCVARVGRRLPGLQTPFR